MACANEILEELKELRSPLAETSRALLFAIPQDYFDGLATSIISGIAASESDDRVLNFPKEMPFKVPDFYFEESAAQILSAANIPARAYDSTDVPDGYFDALPDRILAAVKAQEAPAKKPKTIAFVPARRVIQWAVAAMLVLGIGIGSYRVYDTPDRKAEHQLAGIDGDAINEYVDQSMDDAPASANTIALNVPAADAVKTLSQEEITAYLDEAGWDDPASTN